MVVNIAALLRAMPNPDYANHPAYGGQFRLSTVNDKTRALSVLAPHLASAIKEQLRYRIAVQALHGSFRRSSAGKHLHEAGAIAFSDPNNRLGELKGTISGILGIDFDTVELGAKGIVDYPLAKQKAPQVFATLEKLFRETGALSAASAYLRRRRVGFSGINVKISGPSSTFKKGFFADVCAPDPPTRYLHVDSSPPRGVVKVIIYLGEVTERNGPFSYIIGSHKLHEPWIHRVARRAVHKSGLQRCAPDQRRLFYALPTVFRRKAEIGNDFEIDDPAVTILLRSEKRFTSEDGAFILFDNSGLHRGGLVEEGRRTIIQVILR